MRLYTAVVSVLLVVSAMGFASELTIGESIPSSDVEMLNVDGEMITIGDIKGTNGTLVIFSCNHCPWVKAWEKRIASIGNSYQKKGFGVIVINSNDPSQYEEDSYAEMKKRSDKLGFNFPYAVDANSEIAKDYGASKTPEVFLFNGENILVYKGAIDDNAQHEDQVSSHYLKDALDATIQKKKPDLTETKALGCGIKFR